MISKGSSAEPSKELYQFKLKDVNPRSSTHGSRLGPQDYQSGLLFLNFAAPWCPPCQEEFPNFQDVYDPGKIDFLVVNTDDDTSWADMAEFKDYTYPFLGNSRYPGFGELTGGVVAKRHNIDTVPTTYLVKDRDVKKIKVGGFTKEELAELIEKFGN